MGKLGTLVRYISRRFVCDKEIKLWSKRGLNPPPGGGVVAPKESKNPATAASMQLMSPTTSKGKRSAKLLGATLKLLKVLCGLNLQGDPSELYKYGIAFTKTPTRRNSPPF